MNKTQLEHFLAIAQELNITKAAQRLNIPQPYLSTQLQKLEKELGVVLADRTTRSFRLTDSGKNFAMRCVQILNLMTVTAAELQSFHQGIRGTLRLATTTTPSSYVLPSKLKEFNKLYPHIEYEILSLDTPQILDYIRKGLVDIGILRTPIDSKYFHSICLSTRPMVLVGSPELMNRFEEGTISLSEIENLPLLLNYRLEQTIINACLREGFQPKIVGRIGDTRTVLLCSLKGIAATIVPQQWLEQCFGNAFAFRTINEQLLVSSTSVIWPKDRDIPLAAQKFLDLFGAEQEKLAFQSL